MGWLEGTFRAHTVFSTDVFRAGPWFLEGRCSLWVPVPQRCKPHAPEAVHAPSSPAGPASRDGRLTDPAGEGAQGAELPLFSLCTQPHPHGSDRFLSLSLLPSPPSLCDSIINTLLYLHLGFLFLDHFLRLAYKMVTGFIITWSFSTLELCHGCDLYNSFF